MQGEKVFIQFFIALLTGYGMKIIRRIKFRPGGYATCAGAFCLLGDSSDFGFVHCSEVEENLEYYEIDTFS